MPKHTPPPRAWNGGSEETTAALAAIARLIRKAESESPPITTADEAVAQRTKEVRVLMRHLKDRHSGGLRDMARGDALLIAVEAVRLFAEIRDEERGTK